jgi:hypothetical protein
MPRIAAVCVLLAGCGAETERTATRTPDRATTDRAAIQQRVAVYMKHMLAGEGEQACAQFTPEYRRSMETRGGRRPRRLCRRARDVRREGGAGVARREPGDSMTPDEAHRAMIALLEATRNAPGAAIERSRG